MFEYRVYVEFNVTMDRMNNASNEWSDERIMAYEIGLRSINERAQSEGGIAAMVNALGRQLATERPEEFASIAGLSYRFEQRDPSTGQCMDTDQRASKALIKGVVTGLLVADETYAELADVHEIVECINIKDAPVSDDSTIGESRRHVSETLADIARRGLDQMHHAGQYLERWENECVLDYSHHYYYRLGFGLAMTSANKVVYDKSLAAMHRAVEDETIDWDQEMMKMLGGDS